MGMGIIMIHWHEHEVFGLLGLLFALDPVKKPPGDSRVNRNDSFFFFWSLISIFMLLFYCIHPPLSLVWFGLVSCQADLPCLDLTWLLCWCMLVYCQYLFLHTSCCYCYLLLLLLSIYITGDNLNGLLVLLLPESFCFVFPCFSCDWLVEFDVVVLLLDKI